MGDKSVDLYALDPNFSRGTATFQFENGDQYEGGYCAHITGLVWREGTGTYTTKDGQIYTGEWKDDKIIETTETDVSYPSGVKFFGKIIKNRYGGEGMYVLENQMSVLCEFKDNIPTGEIVLIDTKGREWHGTANEYEALLLPEHIYFNNIHEDLGKGRSRKEPSIMSAQEHVSKKTTVLNGLENMKELELKIFAKTKKTISDLKFEKSDWYQNYTNFKDAYEVIHDKIKQNGENSLDENEMVWYKKFAEFKQTYHEIMNAKQQNKRKLSEYKLFELYNSKEFKASCPPIPVFYPNDNTCGSTECM